MCAFCVIWVSDDDKSITILDNIFSNILDLNLLSYFFFSFGCTFGAKCGFMNIFAF